MSLLRVGVLRGGPSHEYDVSIQTGAAVLRNLPEEYYRPIDIFIDREGGWHYQGITASAPEIKKRVDVIFNALHGAYGEDGKVQRLLDDLLIPYTGSTVAASVLAMHKGHAKKTFHIHDIRTPYGVILSDSADLEEDVRGAYRGVPLPWVVKPVSSGSSVGVSIARDFKGLFDAVERAYEHGDSVLVEEYIRGREATCGVIEDFRDEDLYVLPPVEIIPPGHKTFFDYESKYNGTSQEICPGNFSPEEKRQIIEYAKEVHRALGLRHYSRTDMVVSPRGVFVLEVNTLPGLTQESLFPKSLDAVGVSLSEFLHHILSLATR